MKFIKIFVRARFKEACKQLAIYNGTNQPEALHDCRVEIKKLQAFYLLLGFCNEEFDPEKYFKPLQKIFHQSGPIRDDDVMKQLQRKYKIKFIDPASVLSDKKQQHKIKRFCKHIPAYHHSILKAEKKLELRCKSVSQKCLQQYLLNKVAEINKQLRKRSLEGNLHELRKDIKQFLYLSKIESRLPPKFFSYYNTLQTLIGKWHDQQILNKFLLELSFEKKNAVLKKLQVQSKNILVQIKKLNAKKILVA